MDVLIKTRFPFSIFSFVVFVVFVMFVDFVSEDFIFICLTLICFFFLSFIDSGKCALLK